MKDYQQRLFDFLLEINANEEALNHPHVADAKRLFGEISALCEEDTVDKFQSAYFSGELYRIEDEEVVQGEKPSFMETALWYLVFLEPLTSNKIHLIHRIFEDIGRGAFLPVLENRSITQFPKMLCKLLQNGAQLNMDGDLEIETSEYGFPVRYVLRKAGNVEFPPSCFRLLLVLLNKLLSTSDNVVKLTVSEYQSRINSESYEYTRKIAKKELDALRNIDTAYYEKRGGRWEYCGGDERICTGEAKIVKGGVISFGFGEKFAKGLRDGKAIMDVRAKTLKINPKSSAFFFALYFDVDNRLNIDNKKRRGHAKVSTLLESTPYMKDEDSPQKKVDAFFDAMDATGLTYSVLDPFRRKVEDPRNLLYEDFLHSTVCIDDRSYPAKPQLIAAKAARRKKAKEKAKEKAEAKAKKKGPKRT